MATRRLRRDAQELMANTCVIRRMRQEYTGQASTTEDWEVVASGVPCRVRSQASQERESIGDQTDETWTTWWIHLPHQYRVVKEDRIEVEGAQTFVVVNSQTPEPTFRVETIVRVELPLYLTKAMP